MRFVAWLLIVFSCVAISLASVKVFTAITHPLKFQEEIIIAANENDIKPELIASVINVESSFKPNSKSRKNAIGLMQIKLSTANYLNQLENKNNITETQLFNPKTNIEFGTKYLKYLIKKFEVLETSLAAYNAGETKVRSWLNNKKYSQDGLNLNYIPFEETRNYVEKINKNLKYYKKVFKV